MMPHWARGASGTTVGNVGRIDQTTLTDLRRRIRCLCCPSWTKMSMRRAATARHQKKAVGVGAVDNGVGTQQPTIDGSVEAALKWKRVVGG